MHRIASFSYQRKPLGKEAVASHSNNIASCCPFLKVQGHKQLNQLESVALCARRFPNRCSHRVEFVVTKCCSRMKGMLSRLIPNAIVVNR